MYRLIMYGYNAHARDLELPVKYDLATRTRESSFCFFAKSRESTLIK